MPYKLKEADCSQLSRNEYTPRMLINVNQSMPCAIGDLDAALKLQEDAWPALLVVKPGFAIVDCAHNGTDAFKSRARELGLAPYNFPLGTLHLTSVNPDRKIGLGDGSFVAQTIDDRIFEETRGKLATEKLATLNDLADSNELKYELLARFWSGQALKSVLGASYDPLLKSAALQVFKNLAPDIKENLICPEEDIMLTDEGRTRLNEIKTYWDYLSRETRSYCKSDHIRARLLELADRFPIELDNLGNDKLPRATGQRITEKINALANTSKALYKSLAEDYTYLSSLKDIASSTDGFTASNLKRAQELCSRLQRYIKNQIIYHDKSSYRLKTKCLRAESKLDELEAAHAARAEQKSLEKRVMRQLDEMVGLLNIRPAKNMRTTITTYAREGIVDLYQGDKKLNPMSIRLSERPGTIIVHKGQNFDKLSGETMVCPMGLAEKIDTWKHYHDPVSSSSAKYVRTANGLARIEFNTLRQLFIEHNNLTSSYPVLEFNKAAAKDFVNKITAITGPQSRAGGKHVFALFHKVSLSGETICIRYRSEPTSVVRDLLLPLERGLRLLE